MNKIRNLERQKEETISNMKFEEFKAYQKLLVQRLYKAFIDGNKEEALKNKKSIDEASSILKTKYSNINEIELGLRLEEANKQLIQILEDSNELSKYYLERIHEDYIDIIGLSNDILKALLLFNETYTSKELKNLILDIFESVENRLKIISFYIDLFDDEDLVPNQDQEDFLINRLIEVHDEYRQIREQIKSL